MNPSTQYYVRTRYRSANGLVSEWSKLVAFTTKPDNLDGIQQAKLMHSDPAANDYFSNSVCLSSDGNTALIGDQNKSGYQGAAYVFTRSGSTWTQQAKLMHSDPATYDYFGASVSLSSDGNTALIGASNKTGTYSGQGVAYVFTRSGSTWTQQAKLMLSSPIGSDHFGNSVSLSGDGNTALIGAYQTNDIANNGRGAAYVFVRTDSVWAQQARLTYSSPGNSDYFGWSVSLSSDGNTALIGAYRKYTSYTDQGAAYVFTRSGSTWTQQAKLTHSPSSANSYFGASVSLSSDGNTALIGANYVTQAYTGQGAAYVFTRSGSTWTQQAVLTHGDPAASDQLGTSVSLSSDGNTALVGDPAKKGTYSGQGAVYVFSKSGTKWYQSAKLLVGDPGNGDYFGNSVSLSSDAKIALIGAYYKVGTAGNGQGAAYIFT